MKILIGVHHFPPHYIGGAEWSAFSTAKELQIRGHDIQVIAVEKIDDQTLGGKLWCKDELYEGIKVRRLYFDLTCAPDPFRWGYDNLWIGDFFREAIKQFEPDIFHLFSGYLLTGRPLLVSKDSLIPSVVTLTDFWFLCPRINMLKSNGEISELPINPMSCVRCIAEESRRYRLPASVLPGVMDFYWEQKTKKADRIINRLDFLKQALNTASVIISPSNFLRSMYIQSGILPEKILFSRQGRDFDQLNEEDLKKNKNNNICLGYMGQIAPHKGVHLIFDAMQKLKDLPVELFVYGNSNQYPAYTSKLKKMAGKDLKITFEGVFEGTSQLTNIMKNLDLIIVPSICYENSPNVILESFAYQTPVIAANLGGMAELVQNNQNGLLFEAGDSMDLQDKIRRIVENPDLLQKFKAGILPIKNVATEMDELEEIYGRELLPGNKKADHLLHSKVLIIILNWNGETDTLNCIESLKKMKDQQFDILVVDNGSAVNPADVISKANPEVKMICLKDNLGYVGGNNVGLKYALSRDYAYMLLLNNDTEVSETFLNRLMSVAESNSTVGALSPLICYFEPKELIWSAGGKVDWDDWKTDMIAIGKNIQEYKRSSPYPVDFVTGCAILVKKEVIEKVGFLDDRFFAYYEDVEWCTRIRKAGYEVLVVPDSQIWHKISSQKRAASPMVTYYMIRNRLLFMRLAGSGCIKIIKVALFENIRTVLSWSLKPKWRDKRVLRKAVLQALWDAVIGRWGRTSHVNLLVAFGSNRLVK